MVCVYRYDPQTDMWTAVAPMSISRDAVGVCLLGDRLYAVGGYDGQVYLSTVEAYDPQTNEWTQVYTQKRIDAMVYTCTHKHTRARAHARMYILKKEKSLCSLISFVLILHTHTQQIYMYALICALIQ